MLFRYIPVIQILSFPLILISSCKTDDWELQTQSLLIHSKELDTRHQQIIGSIDSLWDHTAARLDSLLPTNIPPIDRKIFLESRNADHIRMFMSFKQLDSNIQQLINDAGHHDTYIAAKMHALLLEQKEFERKKLILLKKLEEQNTSSSRKLAGQIKMVSNTASVSK